MRPLSQFLMKHKTLQAALAALDSGDLPESLQSLTPEKRKAVLEEEAMQLKAHWPVREFF